MAILPLLEENSPILLPNLHTQKVMHQTNVLHLEVWISLTLLEAQVLQVCVDPGIPSSRSLLEAV